MSLKHFTLASLIALETACVTPSGTGHPRSSPPLEQVTSGTYSQMSGYENEETQRARVAKLIEYLQSNRKVEGQRFREERRDDYHLGILGKEIAPGERFFYDIYVDKSSLSPHDPPSSLFAQYKPKTVTIWLLPHPFEGELKELNLSELVQSELTTLTGSSGKLNHFTTGSIAGHRLSNCRQMGKRTRYLLQQMGMDVLRSDRQDVCRLLHQDLYRRVLDELLELYEGKPKYQEER